MLKLKLKRVGRKNDPQYRAVITPQNNPKKIIEYLGNYNPKLKTGAFKKERIEYWFTQGAQTSDTLWNLLISKCVIKGAKRAVKVLVKKKKEGKK